jgi:tRNA(adenine34) deaminase
MTDDEAMSIALEEARAAAAAGDVPVGCVVLDPSGAVLARAHNQRAVAADPTAHAEVLALREAAGKLGDWRLTGCTLVVTLEPCPMCAGALVAGRVARVVFGAPDAKGGACGSLYNLCVDPRLNHEVQVQHGVRADECAAVLTAFFQARRR